MKAEFREYENDFCIELMPESGEEILRAARLGLTSKKGARVFISFGEKEARISLSFAKNRNKNNSISK
jgi:RAB protein geranylgeranyltransferase component A